MTKTFKITIGVLIITALAVLLVSVSIPKRINNDNDNGNVIVQPIEEQKLTTEEIEEIVPSEDIDTTNWKTYTNEEYGFSFKYPKNSNIGANSYNAPANKVHSIVVFLPASRSVFNIEVQDPEQWQSASNPEILEIINLKLKEFAEKKWQLNKEDRNPNIKNKKVGEVEETSLNDRKAYQFTLTGSYHDEGGGYLLDEIFLYIFIDDKEGMKFMIWFPSNDKISKTILNTFRFLN